MIGKILPLLLLFVVSAAFSQDLVIADRSVPSQVTRYNIPAISVTLENRGILDIEEYTSTVMYLSVDAKIDDNDQYLGSSTTSPLAANASQIYELYSTIVSVSPGSYLLLIKVDYNSEVQETNETNNLTVVPVTILPSSLDFTMTSLNAANPAVAKGDILIAEFGLMNLGTTSTEGFVPVTFFLSADDVFDATDLYLDEAYTFLADQSGTGEMGLIIPNVNPGTYQLLAIANGPAIFNGNRDYDEADVTNNLAAIEIEILAPDIDLEIVSFPFATVQQQSPYSDLYNANISFTLKNNGTTPAADLDVRFYLSSDDQLSDEDWFLFSHSPYFDKINGGEEREEQVDHIVPFAPPGTYYLIASVNPDKEIDETDYDNNTISIYPLEIAPVELVYVEMTGATVDGPVISSDSELSLNVTFQNPSVADYDHSPWLAVSLNNGLGQSIPVESDYPFVSLVQGGETTISVPVELSISLAKGNYVLTIRAEHGNDVTIPFTVIDGYKLTGAITGEDGVPIDHGTLYLYKKASSGKLRFASQYAIGGSNAYAAEINASEHTLYFIPDETLYPDYVPTIYDKVVVIGDATFFSTTQDATRNFQVLKINPLGVGDMTISGTIGDPENSGGRSNARIDNVPVVLLNEGGDVVGLTHTDENGYFEFTNIPAGIYQVVVLMDFSEVAGIEAVQVDVSEYDGGVQFDVDGENVTAVSKSLPSLELSAFAAKKYGDSNFTPVASSNTDQILSFESSNPAVAVIEDGEIKIVGAGSTVITAKLEETDEFFAATSPQQLTVAKADQLVTFGALQSMTIGDEPFLLEATSSFGLDAVFTSSNPDVATIEGSMVTIHDAGTTDITATQPGNENINAATPVTRTFRVNAITAIEKQSAARAYPNPTTGKIRLEGIPYVTKIELVNTLGRTVRVFDAVDDIDLENFPVGFYFLHLQTKSGKTVIRVIKE